ncbi:MAG: mannose-1-phosphate guanylyltransferase [Planctomycetota bacterium]
MAHALPPPLVAVLAGGSGTRFWPAGRTARPKQCLALDGDDPRPLLALTLERVRPLLGAGEATCIVAPPGLRRVLAAAAPDHPASAWLAEPAPRNTAAAVALVAFTAAARDPRTPVLVLPADQHVAPVALYRRALKAMITRARRSEAILTLGLVPTRPATGYGYLRRGEELAAPKGLALHVVERFVEKPDAAKAVRLVRDGNHLWNGGTFAFRAEVFLDALARHLPTVHEPLAAAFGRGVPSARRLAGAWEQLPSISVDYGVMERAERVEVVSAPLTWDDLGSWDAVARGRRADADGNCLRGDVVAVDAKGCVVDAEGGTVALLGVEDLIVVRTGDAVLVARRGRGEDVREIVARLKANARSDLL